jgi:hypothetical protein
MLFLQYVFDLPRGDTSSCRITLKIQKPVKRFLLYIKLFIFDEIFELYLVIQSLQNCNEHVLNEKICVGGIFRIRQTWIKTWEEYLHNFWQDVSLDWNSVCYTFCTYCAYQEGYIEQKNEIERLSCMLHGPQWHHQSSAL